MPRRSGKKSSASIKTRNLNRGDNRSANRRSGSTPAQLRSRRENIRKAQEMRRIEGRKFNLF